MAESPANGRMIAQLRDVQDGIGEWHDWEQLIAIADEVWEHAG